MEHARASKATDFAVLAMQFLEGALAIDEAQRVKGRILCLPTLTLAGHGLELFLKACFFLNGKEPSLRGREGHDIATLWNDDVCNPARGHVFLNALRVAEEPDRNFAHPKFPEGVDPLSLIIEYVERLVELHGKAPYPLR